MTEVQRVTAQEAKAALETWLISLGHSEFDAALVADDAMDHAISQLKEVTDNRESPYDLWYGNEANGGMWVKMVCDSRAHAEAELEDIFATWVDVATITPGVA